MANPHPIQNETLKRHWYKRQHRYTLAKSSTPIKLPVGPVNIKEIVASLTADTFREIIIEGLYRRGLLTTADIEVLGLDADAEI